MQRSIVLAAIALCTACTTNDAGKSSLDPEKVKLAVQLTCALAPTAAEIAKLYTENKAVKTTEQATALLCAAALPIARLPADTPLPAAVPAK